MPPTTLQIEPKVKPFLRWAGGKRWLIDEINKLKPPSINTYREPFLGGGSIFFNMGGIDKAVISDLNTDLINAYQAVRDNAERVIDYLSNYTNSEEEYYRVRAARYRGAYEKAAQFIYLNQTSFNGIYRVNRNGEYNVPYGHRKSVDFVNADNLVAVSKKLQGIDIIHQDFGKSLASLKEGDLIFLDPPYTVAHENNGFIEYNQKIFSLKDQYRLASWLNKINDRGALYILSNAKHEAIDRIYNNTGNIIEVKRHSLIGGKGAKRVLISEYVITNIQT